MQGFNMGHYIPPSALDAGLSANQAAGKPHALGARARKIGQGILTVRFEMPFHVWCHSCPKPTIIAQGVRFNAEKKKVGMYYSTPVWSFRMKHAVCGGWIEVRTDPKRGEYVVVEGGRRRDYGDEEKVEGMEILTEEERERRRNDAFAALEGRKQDEGQVKMDKQRVEELLEVRARDWEDPYAASQRVRRGFRAERKIRVRRERDTEQLRERLGLGIELLEEDEGDRRRAGLVDFGDFGSLERDIGKAAAKPLFGTDMADSKDAGSKNIHPDKHKTRAQAEAEKRKEMLQRELKGNTRAAMDPFLLDNDVLLPRGGLGRSLPGLKKKQSKDAGSKSASEQDAPEVSLTAADTPPPLPDPPTALVDYDSD